MYSFVSVAPADDRGIRSFFGWIHGNCRSLGPQIGPRDDKLNWDAPSNSRARFEITRSETGIPPDLSKSGFAWQLVQGVFWVPMFDLLLSRNSGTDVAELLVIYEAVNSVTLRESLDETLFAFRNSALQIIGHTGVSIS